MMTRIPARRRLLTLALAAALSAPAFAQDFEAFKVSDIRIDGLQRISAGTVFSYLPVERGDTLDRAHELGAGESELENQRVLFGHRSPRFRQIVASMMTSKHDGMRQVRPVTSANIGRPR